MSDFVKVTSDKFHLTGAQKAAILLGELGTEGAARVLSILDLSSDKLRKINVAMASLGSFDFQNTFQVQREISVLEEAAAFGKVHGIWKELEHSVNSEIPAAQIQSNGADSESAKIIAQTIRTWLSGSKEQKS
jgi:flagellar motor switch protein FliG